MMACREQAETPERGSREPVGIGDNTPPLLYRLFLDNIINRKGKGKRFLCRSGERGMNKFRRAALREIIDKIADAKDALEMLKDEEEEYRDNMPENLQGSERYQTADEACDALYEAVSQLEEAGDNIETAVGE